MHTHLQHNNKGFTVIEALVAIAVLLLSITSAFSVAQSSLQSSNFAKNRTTAYYLAQEAIENIRNMRDNNGLEMLKNRTANVSWLKDFAESNEQCGIDSADPCMVDSLGSLNPNPQLCGEGECPNLFLRDEEFFWYKVDNSPGDWSDTNFSRSVRLSSVSGTNNEINVEVTVSWNQGVVPKTLVVSENLYNWQSLEEL